MVLTALALVSLSAVPLAEVWPYSAKRLPDGSVEYSYDLSVVKARKGLGEVAEAHGEEAVAAFLASLPQQGTVRVSPNAELLLSNGRGRERRLASTFSQVADGPLFLGSPLESKPPARLRPSLHPEEPKVLVTGEMLAFAVRRLENAARSAVELDTDGLRRAWLSRLATAIEPLTRTSEELRREGAVMLMGRVNAALACLDDEKPGASSGWVASFSATPSRELSCAWIRAALLARPFEASRGGTAAALVFLEVLEKDSSLKKLWERLRWRRDHFSGSVGSEPALAWFAQTKGNPAVALESMGEFLEALSPDEKVPPPLVAGAQTPFGDFLRELGEAEVSQGVEALAAGARDGRLAPRQVDQASWAEWTEAALAQFVAEAPSPVICNLGWRARSEAVFAKLLGSHFEVGGADAALPSVQEEDETELAVRLAVPPFLDVEPLPGLFSASANSLRRLIADLRAAGLGALKPTPRDDLGTQPFVSSAASLMALLEGLAEISTPGAPKASGKAAAEARSWLARWRTDTLSKYDVRQTIGVSRGSGGGQTVTAIVGVSRRELVVSFLGSPTVELVGPSRGLVVKQSEQRYLVPELITVEAAAPPSAAAMSAAALRSLLDAVPGEVDAAEAAVQAALEQ